MRRERGESWSEGYREKRICRFLVWGKTDMSRMIQRNNEGPKERRNERTNGRTDERTNERTDERTDGRTDGRNYQRKK